MSRVQGLSFRRVWALGFGVSGTLSNMFLAKSHKLNYDKKTRYGVLRSFKQIRIFGKRCSETVSDRGQAFCCEEICVTVIIQL